MLQILEVLFIPTLQAAAGTLEAHMQSTRKRARSRSSAAAAAPAPEPEGLIIRTASPAAAVPAPPRPAADHPDDVEAARRLLEQRRRLRDKLATATAEAHANKTAVEAAERRLQAEQLRVESSRAVLATLERQRAALKLPVE